MTFYAYYAEIPHISGELPIYSHKDNLRSISNFNVYLNQ